MKKFIISPLILLAMLLVFSMGCDPVDPVDPFNPNLTYGEFTDERDGQTYKTRDIGTQTWMAENMNYETGNSWCYENDPANCEIYGRLYDWETALTACPPGWHLPSDAEWTVLTKLGMNAGGKMKSTSSLWQAPNSGATNEIGFSGLPGGYRLYYYFFFDDLGMIGFWWSSTERVADGAWGRYVEYNSGGVYRSSNLKEDGLSVRCLSDDN